MKTFNFPKLAYYLNVLGKACIAVSIWFGLWLVYRFAGLDWFVFIASGLLALQIVGEK